MAKKYNDHKISTYCADCQECDLARMGIGEQPKCTYPKIMKCPNYVHHHCRSCSNMSSCPYVLAGPNRDVKKYPFVKQILKTSHGGIIVSDCANYQFIEDKPRGNIAKAQQTCLDLLDDLAIINRRKSYTEYV